MDYYLEIQKTTEKSTVHLSKEEFDAIMTARLILRLLYDFTENYRVVLESYKHLELTKCEAEINHVISSTPRYKDIDSALIPINTAILGYLTASRYFLDSTTRITQKLLNTDESNNFTLYKNKIYDTVKGYRFIEALRNYVQHRDLPIQSWTYHNFLDGSALEVKASGATCLSLFALREKLEADQQFKKMALNGLPERIDIIHAIRFHMEELWQQYNYLCKIFSDMGVISRVKYSMLIQQYKTNEDGVLTLYVCEQSKNGELITKEPIILDWDDVRIAAVKKIGNLTGLSNRYITGKVQHRIDCSE